MAGIVESYKKVFENKKNNLWIFLVSILWTVSSLSFDIATGNPESPKQNIFDIMFGLFIGVYSLHFLHNAIQNINEGLLPSFKEMKWKTCIDLIKLDVVWGFYAVIVILAAMLLFFTVIHSIIFPITVVVLTAIVAVFVYYIYLAYADEMNTKGLFNVTLIFKIIKSTFKNTFIQFSLFLLVTLLAVLICILIYAVAAITGIDSIWNIAQDYYILDFIVFILAAYFMIITWYFAYPYSLIETYKEKVRPICRKDVNNGENV